MRLSICITLFSALLAIAILPSTAGAGPIGPGDFAPAETQTSDFDNLGLPDPFPAPLIYNQLEIDSLTGLIRYNNFSGCTGGVASDCIGTFSNVGFLDIMFTNPGGVSKAGAFVTAFRPQGWQVQAEFFDLSDQFLGAIDLFGLGTQPQAFAGWEDVDGIGRMRFTDLTPDAFIMVLDNVMVVGIPEPSAALLLGSGLVMLGAHRRGARRR